MKRSKFSLSSYQLLTADMGQLVPVGVEEVLPGDTFQHQTSAMIRVSPMLAPVMHPVQVRIHHFFVPNRVIWDGWEDFITGGRDGLGSSEDFPTIIRGAGGNKDLLDYMGITDDAPNLEVSALPVRAFNLIWNEFYRDNGLQEERDSEDITVPVVNWEKEYFTSARPWTQLGPSVTLPIGGKAPVTGIGFNPSGSYDPSSESFTESNGQTRVYAASRNTDAPLQNNHAIEENPDIPGAPNIFADLTQAEAVDINDFRLAFALQRYQEARARFGSRFVEYLRYLGVRGSDQRLQRPEYLGGGKQTIAFSEVLQTASDDIGQDQTPVGTLRGHGIAALRSNRYRRFFEEHGHVITLMSVRPKLIWTNTVEKKWLRRTKEDFWQKELERVGQQEIMMSEIHANTENPDAVFGYQDRYREYKEGRSKVSAEFRDILDYWHLGRFIGNDPTLGGPFIEANVSKRIHAEQTQNTLWCMINHNLRARRLVSKSNRSSLS